MLNFSIKHPVSVIFIYAGLIVCSLFISRNISLGFNPKIISRKIIIETELKNADAKTIREMVTIPLENACMVLQNQKNISSVSKDGISLIQVEFHYGTDMELAFIKTKEITDSTYESLPYGCKRSNVRILSTENDNFVFSVSSKTKGNNERFYSENILKPDLLRIKGIGDISITGGKTEEIQILLDPEKLKQRKMTIRQVAAAYSNSNCEYPAGKIVDGENLLQVKIDGKIRNVNDIENIIVGYSIDSGSVKIKDLGSVVRANKTKKDFALVNGVESVLISIKYNESENPIKTSKKITEHLSHFNDINGTQYEIKVLHDSAAVLKKENLTVLLQALCSMIITFLCLVFFLNSLKIAIIVSLTIPVCLVLSLAVLTITGNSLNAVSISGLTLGIGLIVDCSALVAERFISKNDLLKGTKGILASNIGSTATTVIAFAPVFFITGPIKEVFSCLSIAIISCVLFSFFISCSFTVALLKLFYDVNRKQNSDFQKLLKVKLLYRKLLYKTINKPFILAVIITILIIFGFISAAKMGFNFFNIKHTEKVTLILNFNSEITTKYIQKEGIKIYEKLKDIPQIKNIVITGGELNTLNEFSSDSFVKNKIKIQLNIKKMDISELKKVILDLFNQEKIHIEYENNQIHKMFLDDSENLVITAEDTDKLNSKSDIIKNEIDCSIIPDETAIEWEYIPSMEMLSKSEISAEYVYSQIEDFINGIDFTPFYEKNKKIPCRVQLSNKNESPLIFFESFLLFINEKPVPLSALGKLLENKKTKTFFRLNRKDAKIIIPKNEISSEKINNLEIYDKNFEYSKEFFYEIIILLLLVCVLIYIFIAIIFESYTEPIIICCTILLSIPGAFIGIFISGFKIDYNMIISLVILLGLSSNNSILLMEGIRENKVLTNKIIVEESVSRLKALLITNGTTILSLIPFIRSSSISVSIIGGLLVSLPINAFLIPVIIILRGKNIESK